MAALGSVSESPQKPRGISEWELPDGTGQRVFAHIDSVLDDDLSTDIPVENEPLIRSYEEPAPYPEYFGEDPEGDSTPPPISQKRGILLLSPQ